MVKRTRPTSSPQVITTKKRRLDVPPIRVMNGIDDDAVASVGTLLKKCFSQTRSVFDAYIKFLKNKQHLVLCIYDISEPTKLVGMCVYNRYNGVLSDGSQCPKLITMNCTLPDFSKLHYMEYLINYLISHEYIHSRNDNLNTIYDINAIYTEVPKTDTISRQFYRQLGFHTDRSIGENILLRLNIMFDKPFYRPLCGGESLSKYTDGVHKIKHPSGTNDCALRMMKILGAVSSGQSFDKNMRQYLKTGVEGTPGDYILNVLSFKFGKLISIMNIEFRSIVKKFIEAIPPKTILPIGYQWFDTKYRTYKGHVLVIGRTTKKKLFCYEDQTGDIYMGDRAVRQHLFSEEKIMWNLFCTSTGRNFPSFRLKSVVGAQLQLSPLPIYQKIMDKKNTMQDLIKTFASLRLSSPRIKKTS